MSTLKGSEWLNTMNSQNLSTKLIHTGDGQVCKELAKTASVPETFPIYLTSVFSFDDVPSVDAIYEGEADGYIYSRSANPNADAVSRILAAAEGGEKALVFSSGMAAITTSILSFVKSGDHIIASNVLYGGVYDYLANELPRFGVEVTFVNLLREDLAASFRPNTKLLYTETINNPLMEVPDIAAAAKTAHEGGALLLVDNTFATPVLVKPLSLGADVVLHSATKYLGGHSDITAGVAVTRAELAETIKRFQVLYGAVPSPMDCWLLARSLRTLELRVEKHSKNALAVARFLDFHPKVEKVFYPGLPSSPSHERAKRQFAQERYGGMLSADVKGGVAEASALIKALSMISFVPSLAGTATTVSYPVKTSHRFYDKEELDKTGIAQGQLRFSIGLEDENDIIEDFSQALEKI
ncbi:MAG: aminotransferase class I/II-fold pyridoxal phosphate-dependent enzyme [Synergistaceae bacterium]|jgi:methionine-gamma-lyase|nr:aminotransferase class I/II-fold pyridoxal phosphate-dependent enzyme [Synergistaceae bacterium]